MKVFESLENIWKGLGTVKQTEFFVFLIAAVAVMLLVTLAPRVPIVNFSSLTT